MIKGISIVLQKFCKDPSYVSFHKFMDHRNQIKFNFIIVLVFEWFLLLPTGLQNFDFSSLIFNCFYLVLESFYHSRICKFCFLIIWLWLKGNISSPVRDSYLSVLPDDNADGFAASLLVLYCKAMSRISSKFFWDRKIRLCNGNKANV